MTSSRQHTLLYLMQLRRCFFWILILSSVIPKMVYPQDTQIQDGKDTDAFSTKRLSLSYQSKDSTLTFTISNQSLDTVYIFSSYLKERIKYSKYLIRYSKEKKAIKVSFLPLISFLSTKSTDKRIIGETQLINRGQILYEFIKLAPGSTLKFEYDLNEISFKIPREVYLDFDFSKTNKWRPIRFRRKKIRKNPGLIFEFAYYDSIRILSDQNTYFLNEYEFNEEAKSLNLLSKQVSLSELPPN